jgi:hypothetical protein
LSKIVTSSGSATPFALLLLLTPFRKSYWVSLANGLHLVNYRVIKHSRI